MTCITRSDYVLEYKGTIFFIRWADANVKYGSLGGDTAMCISSKIGGN